MKIEKKQCTKCRQPLSLECFRISKRTAQLTKQCVKSLDICERSRQRTKCEHGRQRSQSKDCDGSQICEHNKRKSTCKDCGGVHICEHNKIKLCCKDCGGSQICEHNKIKSYCLFCGGSQICEHNKRRPICLFCGGSQICEHNRERSTCPTCDPLGHLAGVVRSRIYIALKNDKEMSSTEHLGCNIETFKKHIEQ